MNGDEQVLWILRGLEDKKWVGKILVSGSAIQQLLEGYTLPRILLSRSKRGYEGFKWPITPVTNVSTGLIDHEEISSVSELNWDNWHNNPPVYHSHNSNVIFSWVFFSFASTSAVHILFFFRSKALDEEMLLRFLVILYFSLCTSFVGRYLSFFILKKFIWTYLSVSRAIQFYRCGMHAGCMSSRFCQHNSWVSI